MNSPLQTRIDTHQFGGVDYHIRCLVDGNQFDDPEGVAEALGISPASWPFFGMRWPSGLLLADLVSRLVLGGGRMLELGCGLGIASLVANARGADILATDYHPMAADFLRDNSARNALFPTPFQRLDWRDTQPGLGLFDVIHPDQLDPASLAKRLAELLPHTKVPPPDWGQLDLNGLPTLTREVESLLEGGEDLGVREREAGSVVG